MTMTCLLAQVLLLGLCHCLCMAGMAGQLVARAAAQMRCLGLLRSLDLSIPSIGPPPAGHAAHNDLDDPKRPFDPLLLLIVINM